MFYHSELVIYHLLYLYFALTEKNEIDLDILQDAFYEFCDNINNLNGCQQDFDFEEEIENLLANYGYLFESFDNDLSFSYEDYEDIEGILLESIEDVTAIDRFMIDALYNENIYHALRIPAPITEFQNLFSLNASLLAYYKLLAHQELNGTSNEVTRKIIKFQLDNLKRFICECDNVTRIKIKLCLSYYNEKFLSDKCSPNINSNWHILLLGKGTTIKNTLTYDKIFYYIDSDSEIVKEDKDKESEDKEDKEMTVAELVQGSYYIDELVVFLSHYIIYLNEFCKDEQDPKVKQALTEIKYAMFSLGDLDEIEQYFLENGSLDNLHLPDIKKEWLHEQHFDFLIGNFEEILSNIKVKDQDLSANSKKDIILNILLLKCYLDLSINEQIRQELIAELTSPIVYKNPEYTYLSNMIDEIIFKEKFLNRLRKPKVE